MSEIDNRVTDLRHPLAEIPSYACSDSGIPNTDGVYPVSRITSRDDLPHQSLANPSNGRAKLTSRHAVKRRQNSSLPPESTTRSAATRSSTTGRNNIRSISSNNAVSESDDESHTGDRVKRLGS